MQTLHLTFDCMYCSQKLGEDFAKFCGLLRIYELYIPSTIFNSEAEGRRDEYDIFLLSRDTNKYLFSLEIVHDIDG